jgi:formylglycine-generating enzyme required for sulfatase activity
MKKLLIVALLLNAAFLFAIGQQLSVVAEVGTGAGVEPCDADATKYSLDTNDDGAIDLSDFVYGLSWFFSGTEAPRVCLGTDDLEARMSAVESEVANLQNQHPVDWSALENVPAGFADGVDNDGGPPVISGFTLVKTNTEGYPEYTHDASGIRFVRLPGGSFDMGSPLTETGRLTYEGPVHTVSLSPFLIAKYEVTQSEYEGVMTGNTAGLDATPSSATGDNLPVEQVSWDDLKNSDGFLARTGLSLPSEAQWEYACRAGTSGPYAGNGILADMGWYDGNSGDSSHDVGGKHANQFGLHDMHGNVLEWCEDVFKEDFYADDVPGFDPVSTTGSGSRVLRGGHFHLFALFARSAGRDILNPSFRFIALGFRPARPLP